MKYSRALLIALPPLLVSLLLAAPPGLLFGPPHWGTSRPISRTLSFSLPPFRRPVRQPVGGFSCAGRVAGPA